MEWESQFDLKQLRLAAELARISAGPTPTTGNRLILGRALIASGEFSEAVLCLRDAIALLPPSAELEAALTEALIADDLFDEALLHAETALALAPADLHKKRLYVRVLGLLNRWDLTGREPDADDTLLPGDARLMARRAEVLGPAATVELCDVQLAADPAHTNAKYLKAVALARLGRADDARSLMALDQLVHIQQLEPPANYDTGEAFRRALAHEITTNSTLTRDPRSKATRGGLHTRFLRQLNATAIEALLAQLRQAVDGHERQLEVSGLEFGRVRPRKVRLEAWAVVHGSAGWQEAHRHPDGWLSGVYYVAAPRVDFAGTYRGRLIMGALDPKDGVDPPWGTRPIEPVPGRLVMFPSYIPHATEVSGVGGERICVAFDVAPVR